MINKKILIIGLIWPEPEATAAGTRMIQLIDFFTRQGYELYFASASLRSDLSFDFTKTAVTPLDIELNSSSFDTDLKNLNPDIVVFDRFLTEEQYGWRVRDTCPKAIRILDTEDLHFLRKSREVAIKKGIDDWRPFMNNDTTKREIASIYRCDLSLIISKFELSLLSEEFKISSSLLLYLPFLVDLPKKESNVKLPEFDQRKTFMTIGNFKHKPNVDAVIYLYSHIWPLIKKELPQSELHIFGPYAPEGIRQLHNKTKGFLIKGWISDKKEAFIKSRVCLAPLRFGAGQKGKLLDAMYYGTPSVTSSIGAEGMETFKKWNGFIEDDMESFASKAIKLYQDETLWKEAQETGFYLLKENYDRNFFESLFIKRLQLLSRNLETHRNSNFIGSMLAHHQHQSTKYLSKWIEVKNLMNNKIIK